MEKYAGASRDGGQVIKKAKSEEYCRQACKFYSKCVGVVWNMTDSTCSMFVNEGERKDNQDCCNYYHKTKCSA